MRKWITLLGAMLLCTGCSAVRQPNDMAYAVTMSLDRTDTGAMEIAIQVPSISPKSSENIILSAEGATFAEALDVLEATAQRSVDLSQLKSLIVSKTMAMEADFSDTLTQVLLTRDLFGEAALVVSVNPAKEVLAAQKAVIGERLAQSVASAIAHYREHGYVPDAGISDTVYRFHSLYSDPVAILACTADGTDTRFIPPGRMGEGSAGTLPRKGENKNEYFGSALFAQGRMVGVLNGREEQLRGLISGEVREMNRMCGECTVKLTREKRRIRVDTDRPAVDVRLVLSMEPLAEAPDPAVLAAELTKEIEALFEKCKSLHTEPFGLGEIAASSFLTLEDLAAYDWRGRFPQAEITVRVEIHT